MEKREIKAITIADNEDYLRQVSSEVDVNNDKDLENDIVILEEFCKGHSVMAMAAVQLGIPKRIVYLKNTNLEIIIKYKPTVSMKKRKIIMKQEFLLTQLLQTEKA